MFCFHVVRLPARIKHILVCTAVSISSAPGGHRSDCIRFASWKECKALFAQGNNPIQSEWGQQLWRQNWNNNFFLKAKRFFFSFSKLISICVLSILSYDRPLQGAVSTLCLNRRQRSAVWRIMNPWRWFSPALLILSPKASWTLTSFLKKTNGPSDRVTRKHKLV